ncbi:hypothetical protein P4H66_22695 [Paenibacillus dokdonensis]|uniref:DUF11 domain-containing protein n=1 Tax=Paenibacillus dokdonensis TaxID=2567944 RepID=A0ABU6GSA1_9BACL|nr:hypothetical protein [Paenibacillus dokdonensis]MEC0242625.1 hypothetical protein [Paenibacillus dokdonensis]
MRKQGTIYIAVLLSIFVISQISPYPIQAASVQSGTKTTGVSNSSLGTIPLNSKIKATLEEVNIWPQATGNIVTYTLNYTNTGNSSVSLMNFFSKVVSPGGSIILGHPITNDVSKKNVSSNESIRVTYYVNMKQLNSLKGMKFPVYVWDINAKDYLKHAGTFTLPANYSNVTPIGKSINTTMNNNPVAAGSQSLEIYKYNGKVYAKVGFNLTNQGSKVFEDPGYKAYLVSAGGSIFKLSISGSQTDYKIQPNEKKTIYYVTEIPSYLKTDNMKLQFTQKDEALQLEYAGSSYKLPAAAMANLVVGKNDVKKIMVHNNIIETELQNASVTSEDGKGEWSFQLRMKNTGNKAVTLPAYDLAVNAKIGKRFPLDSKGLSGLVIKPMEEKIIPLRVQIPLEIEQNTLQLELIESVSKELAGDTAAAGTVEATGTKEPSAELKLPIAYFTIPYVLHTDAQKGQVYSATNSYGTFSYSLQSLQRLPWKDEDILAAKLNITNMQSTNLSLPDLKGMLKIDNDDLSASTEIMMDKDVAVLGPGQSTNINVIAHIPYTQEFHTLKVNLFSSEKDEKIPFLTLSTPNTMTAIESIKQGGSYVVSGLGRNAEIKENKTIVYEGMNSNIVYTEMLLGSEEKRQSKMARLQAYYRTADGQLYEAVSNQPDTPATPDVKQFITFSAKLPKSAVTSDLSLYIGPGITGTKFTEPGEAPTGYIDISALQLNPAVSRPQTSLTQVSLYPYQLSVLNSKGWTVEGSDSLNITMNYNLQRENSYDMGNFNHKLVLKMTDAAGQSQEKNLNIGTDLTVGNYNTFMATFSSNQYKTLTGGFYRLTLYDELMGERIELASQTYNLSIEKAQETEK